MNVADFLHATISFRKFVSLNLRSKVLNARSKALNVRSKALNIEFDWLQHKMRLITTQNETNCSGKCN